MSYYIYWNTNLLEKVFLKRIKIVFFEDVLIKINVDDTTLVDNT